MEDCRFQWFKDVIYRAFFIDAADPAFNDLLERDASSKENIQLIISGSNKLKSCIFVYYTVEEQEVEVEDIYEPTEASSQLEGSVSSESEKLDSENASTVEKTDDKSLENVEDVDNLEVHVDSPDETEKTEAYVSKRLKRKSTTSLLQIIKKNILHISFNSMKYLSAHRYVYFLQSKLEPIPSVENLEDAYNIMLDHFEIGSINQHPLISMNKVISNVYLPIIQNKEWVSYSIPSECQMDKTQVSSSFTELEKEIKSFIKCSEETILQIEQPLMFHVPNITTDCNINELAEEQSFIVEAEELIIEWAEVISDMLEKTVKKKPPENDIVAEIKFWKSKKFSLSTCFDHLNQHSIQQTIQILKLANSNVNEFEAKAEEVQNYLNIASDNYNYISLLEPLLDNLHPNQSLENSMRAIEDIFLLLKMIWIQSNYYKEIPNMCRLIKGISDLLKEKVKDNINVEVLFRKDLQEVYNIVTNSSKLLSFWKDQYLKQSESVKKYGGSYWWGFDIQVFFTETDHMIFICSHLENIAVALEEMYNIFKTNIKYYVQDMKGLKILEVRVFGIASRIQYANFDIFDPECKPNWEKLIKSFHRDVKNLEDEIKSFIRKIFHSLTWQNAYALSRSFSNAKVSKSMLDFVNKSRNDMLKLFIKEIQEKESEFLTLKDEPPIYEGIPKTISAVLWVEDIFKKMSVSMSQICDHKNLSKQELEVQDCFKKTSLLLEKYKLQKYNDWKFIANEMLHRFMQENILKECEGKVLNLKSKNFQKIWKYNVNFPIYFEEISAEAKLLEYYGYDIPMFIKEILFQEKQYYECQHKMRITLDALRNIISNLSEDEISLLDKPIDNVCYVLDDGLHIIQWESSEIFDFVKKAKRAVYVFGSLIKQTQNIFFELNSRIESLENFQLFHFYLCDKRQIPTCEEFFNDAKDEIKKVVRNLVNTHSSLELLLKNLEKITSKTVTGKAIEMKQYYLKCEEQILKYLLKMMLLNLEYFKDELLKSYILPFVDIAFRFGNEVVVSSLQRAELIFITFIKDAMESSRQIVRWLDGTCIKSPCISLEESKEKLEFSYYLDICMHPKIKKLTLSIINDFIENFNKMKRN